MILTLLHTSYRLLTSVCAVRNIIIYMNNNRIFVVDDDKGIREILKNLLESKYSVEIFEHGYDAVKEIPKVKPKVLLLDYFLPGENAEKVIADVKKNTNVDLKIIVMSASLHIKQDLSGIGVSEFITKPFTIDTIYSVLDKYIN